jgi:hypothetical protein
MHSKVQKNSKQKSFHLKNLNFLIPRNLIFYQRTLFVFQGWVGGGVNFWILSSFDLEARASFWISLTPI